MAPNHRADRRVQCHEPHPVRGDRAYRPGSRSHLRVPGAVGGSDRQFASRTRHRVRDPRRDRRCRAHQPWSDDRRARHRSRTHRRRRMGCLHSPEPQRRTTATGLARHRHRQWSHRRTLATGRGRLVPRASTHAAHGGARVRVRTAVFHCALRRRPCRVTPHPRVDVRHIHQHQPGVGRTGRVDDPAPDSRSERVGRYRSHRPQQRCAASADCLPTKRRLYSASDGAVPFVAGQA